jgi:hypothetical protein
MRTLTSFPLHRSAILADGYQPDPSQPEDGQDNEQALPEKRRLNLGDLPAHG